MDSAYGYLRESTEDQEESGLGLDAQRNAISNFCKKYGYELRGFFVEIDSGKNNKRPELETALKKCKKEHATLLIASLDRLSRRVAFTAALLETGPHFRLVEYPDADEFMIHILAVFAQRERKVISQRTKDALAAAKRRGIELGKHGKYVLSQYNQIRADQFARTIMVIIEALKKEGFTTIRAIADELNKRKVPTFRQQKHKWHHNTIQNLLNRIKRL